MRYYILKPVMSSNFLISCDHCHYLYCRLINRIEFLASWMSLIGRCCRPKATAYSVFLVALRFLRQLFDMRNNFFLLANFIVL